MTPSRAAGTARAAWPTGTRPATCSPSWTWRCRRLRSSSRQWSLRASTMPSPLRSWGLVLMSRTRNPYVKIDKDVKTLMSTLTSMSTDLDVNIDLNVSVRPLPINVLPRSCGGWRARRGKQEGHGGGTTEPPLRLRASGPPPVHRGRGDCGHLPEDPLLHHRGQEHLCVSASLCCLVNICIAHFDRGKTSNPPFLV